MERFISTLESECTIVLLISNSNEIVLTLGNTEKALSLSISGLFADGLNLNDIQWQKFFTDDPNFTFACQTLTTVDNQDVLFLTIPIDNKISGIQAAIILMNPTRINRLKLGTKDTPISKTFIMESPIMKKIMNIIEKICYVDSTVLLLGESGVGKTAIAKLIHELSDRSVNPFVSVNCGSLPETLIELELFGYESGSFTGGNTKGKIGLFEVANKGTLFLDEITELPINVQSKLLEVLQENKFYKIGGMRKIEIDVRIIAATNKDLTDLVSKKLFREDLFYRINVVPLEIAPLRERKDDIPKLIEHILQKYNNKYGRAFTIDAYTTNKMLNYDWPGNIRELENLIQRMVVTNSLEIFNPFISDINKQTKDDSHSFNPEVIVPLIPLKKAKKMLEKELVLKAYSLYGSTYKAAKVLEVDQSTIVRKLKEYKFHEQ